MKKEENFEDMKKLFSGDIELPESLSKENIVRKIKESGVKPEKKGKIKKFPKLVAAAAAFAVVAVGAFAAYEIAFGTNRPVNYSPAVVRDEVRQETASEPAEEKTEKKQEVFTELDVGTEKVNLSKFKSNGDLENYRKNVIAARRKAYGDVGFYNGIFSKTKSSEVADSAPMMPATNESGSTDSAARDFSFAETNTQVSGVDEADIVKTDGNFLYIISNNTLSIIDAGTMKLESQTELQPSSKKRAAYVSEMYLSGNRLVVTGYETEKRNDSGAKDTLVDYSGCYFGYHILGSFSAVFDITERDNIKQLRRVDQDGAVVSSRMIGSVLYTVTSHSPDYSEDTAFYAKVNGKELSCDEIYVEESREKASGEASTNAVSTVITAYDTANDSSTVSKASVLSSARTVYCSTDTLYITCNRYDTTGFQNSTTQIHAFSLKNGEVSYKGSASVPGSCDGQYAMDQDGKFFRIATTDYNYKTDKDISSLFVLDENLKVVGKLEDIAPDEQIKSVRFMGNTAYVVTFKNTDPLFAIDLSKPNEPKILGKVKLPGFSEYLHPLSDTLLVGIGYDGNEEEADFSKIKISLFDVSNKKSPKELASHVIKNASCNINSWDAKAFLMIDKNTFGIPVTYYDGNASKLIFKTFTVENNDFTEKNAYLHSNGIEYSNVFRGSFIGKYVYTISDNTVKQFDMQSEKELSSLVYYESKTDSEGSSVTVYVPQ